MSEKPEPTEPLVPSAEGVPEGTFQDAYAGSPPWDIGRPQGIFVRLEEAGEIHGSVLDAGCGTGENALYLASRGHEVWGVDFVAGAIEKARAKAAERGLAVTFERADARKLGSLGRTFDTVIDAGLLHVFSDADRARYIESLGVALVPGGKFHFLGFSDRTPGVIGPRRLRREEILAAFGHGWAVRSLERAHFEAQGPMGPHVEAWAATVEKLP
jgi:SAM-dependent methyltransferase